MRCKVYGKFLRVRNDPKTNPTTFLRKTGLLHLKKEYRAAFNYLKGSMHIDLDNRLPYRVLKIYVRKSSIVCDRQLVQVGDAHNFGKKPKVETIHAMDVVLYTLISNPRLQSPLLESGQNLSDFLTSIGNDSTLVTSNGKVNKKRKFTDESKSEKSKLDRILDPRLRELPTSFDLSAKRRRSARLQVLTTKVYVIRDRKDIDNLENIYAEDISIPNTHPQAMKSAFSIL